MPSSTGVHHDIQAGCRLKREGALSRGDLVATRHLGTCEVVTVESTHAITVRSVSADTHHRLHCVFGPGVSLADA